MIKKINCTQAVRLDLLIAGAKLNISRSLAAELIKNGQVLINKQKVIKPGYQCQSGQLISINLPPAKELKLIPTKGKLDIVFSGNDFLIINKPPFVPVHPSFGHQNDTLVNILLHHYPKLAQTFQPINNIHRPGIVHRLDMNTSGLIVVAKNQDSLQKLQLDLQKQHWQKKYYALVFNNSQKDGGVIDKNIVRDPKHRQKYLATSLNRGKTAKTSYKIIKNFYYKQSLISLVDVQIATGRTHQIRVHLLAENMPILGDTVYFNKESAKLTKELKIPRQLLHAYYLKIDNQAFQIGLPNDFQAVVDKL